MKNKKFYIYKFLNCDNEVIYIGKTTNIHNRISNHFGEGGHLPEDCYLECEEVKFLTCNNPVEMDMGEIFLINKYKPKYNKTSKYDIECNIDFHMNDNWDTLYMNNYKAKYNYIRFRENVLIDMTKELETLKKSYLDLKNKIENLEKRIQDYNQIKNYIGDNADYLMYLEDSDKEKSEALLKSIKTLYNFIINNKYNDEMYRIINDNIIAINISELYYITCDNSLDLNSFRRMIKKSGLLQYYDGEFSKTMKFKKVSKKVHYINFSALEALVSTE